MGWSNEPSSVRRRSAANTPKSWIVAAPWSPGRTLWRFGHWYGSPGRGGGGDGFRQRLGLRAAWDESPGVLDGALRGARLLAEELLLGGGEAEPRQRRRDLARRLRQGRGGFPGGLLGRRLGREALLAEEVLLGWRETPGGPGGGFRRLRDLGRRDLGGRPDWRRRSGLGRPLSRQAEAALPPALPEGPGGGAPAGPP